VKKLLVFGLMMFLVGCSRETEILAPTAEPEMQVQKIIPDLLTYPMFDGELTRTAYQVVGVFPGGYMLYVKPFPNKHTDLIIVLIRTGGIVNALVYPEGTFSVYGSWLKLKPQGSPNDIIGVYIHGVVL
jgi:hypothetical protein